jgi:hypothetical protein
VKLRCLTEGGPAAKRFSRDDFEIPVAQGAPGVGKSRILDEARSALLATVRGCTTQEERVFDEVFGKRIVEVRVTYNSGTCFDLRADGALGGPVQSLCARILYSCFVSGGSENVDWRSFVSDLAKCKSFAESMTLPLTIKCVHYAAGRPVSWMLLLCVDEAAVLHDWSVRQTDATGLQCGVRRAWRQ